MTGDIEPNNTPETATDQGILSLVSSGASTNAILLGDVQFDGDPSSPDPEDFYVFSISEELTSLYVDISFVGFNNTYLDDAGVNGVQSSLLIGGFGFNAFMIRQQTGSMVKQYDDELNAILGEIAELRIAIGENRLDKSRAGTPTTGEDADLEALNTLRERVFSLYEFDETNVDHDALSHSIRAFRDASVFGSAYFQDVLDVMTRAAELAETWATPVYAVADLDSGFAFTEMDFLDAFAAQTWEVFADDGQVYFSVSGAHSLAAGARYTGERSKAIDYSIALTIAREGSETTPEPISPNAVDGDAGDNALVGTDGDDFLSGEAGNDTLTGNEGDDFLDGGAGEDTASYKDAPGGVSVDLRASGQDIGADQGRDSFEQIENLEGSDFADLLQGDNQANVIFGLGARDVIYGWDGADLIYGGQGNDSVRGGADDDDLYGEDGTDFLLGNRGDDNLDGGAGDDVLDGGTGIDFAYYEAAESGVYVDLRFSGRVGGGGLGRDSFISIEGVVGSVFDDRLVGTGGNNAIEGRAGNDVLKGKGGNDELFGGAGDDRMRAESGDDYLQGDDGSDILIALAGDDTLFGDEGDDFLYGGRDDDELSGGAGDDVLRGNLGVDQMFGDAGRDDLRGGGSNDTLDGGAGNDVLFGQNGADILNGGAGNDVMTGGSGGGTADGHRDVFVFGLTVLGNGGFDRIKDFENGVDQLDLTGFGYTSFNAQVLIKATDTAGGLRIDFNEEDTLFLHDFTKAQFDTGDVLL